MHYFGVNCGPIALIFHKKKERSILKSQNVENWTYQVLISKFRLLFACSSCMSTSSFNSKNFSNQAQPRSHAHHTSFTQVTARFPSRAFGAPWSNHSLKRICYQISRDQADHDVSSKLLSQVGHQQDRRHLLVPRRFLDLPVLTPERSDNKFASRNDSTVARVCWCSKEFFRRCNSKSKLYCRYWDEWSWFRSSLDDRSDINCILENTSVVPSSNFVDNIHCASRICLAANAKALVSRWRQICPLKINICTLNEPISTNEVSMFKLAIEVCFENHSGVILAIF